LRAFGTYHSVNTTVNAAAAIACNARLTAL